MYTNTYIITITCAILVAIAGYAGFWFKKLYNKYINTETKKNIVDACVKATEQLYSDLHGEEKLNKCMDSVSKILKEKGIDISDLELRMLIESAVYEFCNTFTLKE